MRARVSVRLAELEAAHLADLVGEFVELLSEAEGSDTPPDPAIARLVPDAYRDDAEAAGEFRRLTQNDLLDRRRDDATLVLATLSGEAESRASGAPGHPSARAGVAIALDEAAAAAWLRTLTALRLVLATRLGITDDDADEDGPDFGTYHWLGYRLELLVRALEA